MNIERAQLESQTADVISRFNRAFVEHEPQLLEDLVANDCVMESVEPAPDGTRYEGRTRCLSFWQNLAREGESWFEPEEVLIAGDRATIRWRYRFGVCGESSVRGVNLMWVRDGKIVEALGYSKSGASDVAAALNRATGE